MLRICTFVSLLCFALVGACAPQQKEEKLNGTSVRVQIPVSNAGDYRLKVVELFTLQNLNSLKGSAARFLIDPDTISGSMKGRSPHLRYIRDKDNVVVPTDQMSLQLLTVYAHFEKLKELDQKMEIGNLLSYPRIVAFSTQARDQQGNLLTDNAQYLGDHDAFLVVPYNQESLPLMANGGVIGHEHFHSIFQKLFIMPLVKTNQFPDPEKAKQKESRKEAEVTNEAEALEIKPIADHSYGRRERIENFVDQSIAELSANEREIFHVILIRGINEGLADLWGWVYTGDTSFVGRSLPLHKAQRDFGGEPLALDPLNSLKRNISKISIGSLVDSYPYRYGNQVAGLIRHVANLQALRLKADQNEIRMIVGKSIISSLEHLRKDFASLKSKELYSLSRAVKILVTRIPNLHGKDCSSIVPYIPEGDPEKDLLRAECRKLSENEESPRT